MPGKRDPPRRRKHDASYNSSFACRRTVADTLRAVASDLARHLARDRFDPRTAQELSRVLDELPEAGEVPGIVKLIFACETAEEFLKRVREA